MLKRFAVAGLGLVVWLSGCAAPPSPSHAAPSTVTICGTTETAASREGAAPMHLVLRDARSGTRFALVIPDSVRGAFVQAFGSDPEAALAGTSLCATGTLRDDALELATPGDVTVHSREHP